MDATAFPEIIAVDFVYPILCIPYLLAAFTPHVRKETWFRVSLAFCGFYHFFNLVTYLSRSWDFGRAITFYLLISLFASLRAIAFGAIYLAITCVAVTCLGTAWQLRHLALGRIRQICMNVRHIIGIWIHQWQLSLWHFCIFWPGAWTWGIITSVNDFVVALPLDWTEIGPHALEERVEVPEMEQVSPQKEVSMPLPAPPQKEEPSSQEADSRPSAAQDEPARTRPRRKQVSFPEEVIERAEQKEYEEQKRLLWQMRMVASCRHAREEQAHCQPATNPRESPREDSTVSPIKDSVVETPAEISAHESREIAPPVANITAEEVSPLLIGILVLPYNDQPTQSFEPAAVASSFVEIPPVPVPSLLPPAPQQLAVTQLHSGFHEELPQDMEIDLPSDDPGPMDEDDAVDDNGNHIEGHSDTEMELENNGPATSANPVQEATAGPEIDMGEAAHSAPELPRANVVPCRQCRKPVSEDSLLRMCKTCSSASQKKDEKKREGDPEEQEAQPRKAFKEDTDLVEPADDDCMDVDIKRLDAGREESGCDGEGRTLNELFVRKHEWKQKTQFREEAVHYEVWTYKDPLKYWPSEVNHPLYYRSRDEAQTLIQDWVARSANDMLDLFTTKTVLFGRMHEEFKKRTVFYGPEYVTFNMQVIAKRFEHIIEFGIENGRWRGDRIRANRLFGIKKEIGNFGPAAGRLREKIREWNANNTDCKVDEKLLLGACKLLTQINNAGQPLAVPTTRNTAATGRPPQRSSSLGQ